MAKYKMQIKLQDETMQDLDLDAKSLDGKDSTYYLNYNNFNNTPTIPTKLSELENDTGFITNSSKEPIPNTGTLSEFNIDTSKTIEETKAILRTLTYTPIEGDASESQYFIAKDDTVGTIGIMADINANEYAIVVMSGGVINCLFSTGPYTEAMPEIIGKEVPEGWNTDKIVDGKFILSTPFASLVSTSGLENDKLIDIMWIDGEGATNDSLSEEDVLEIIENNSETTSTMEFSTLELGTSGNYDTESDNQVATTKAVQTIVNLALGDIEALLEAI